MSIWTDERVELLKLRWAEGFSASAVAIELGNGLTRNAILGKINRLGIPAREVVNYRVSGARIVSASTPKPRRVNPPRLRLEEIGLTPLPPPAPEIFTAEHFCTLEQLTAHSCRWPTWPADAPPSEKFFCGTPTADVFGGRPYCWLHSRVAFTEQQNRKPRPYWSDRAA